MSRTLRADALDNRERILGAARELLSAEGLNVPTRKIARRAGVGPATVYRRFPARQDLVAAAFADQLRACRTIVDEGSAAPDPWQGLCLVIERICELHARDRGFTEAFLSAFPGPPKSPGAASTRSGPWRSWPGEPERRGACVRTSCWTISS